MCTYRLPAISGEAPTEGIPPWQWESAQRLTAIRGKARDANKVWLHKLLVLNALRHQW
jgi:hypothetical protein